MSKKEPTDRQLVMWCMHEAIRGYHDLRPSWVSVQFAVNAAFRIEIRERRAKRLRSMILDEVNDLLTRYARKAHVLL